jgi:hypothetical protein
MLCSVCTDVQVRTLCVLCHAEVTRQQAGERASDKRKAAAAQYEKAQQPFKPQLPNDSMEDTTAYNSAKPAAPAAAATAAAVTGSAGGSKQRQQHSVSADNVFAQFAADVVDEDIAMITSSATAATKTATTAATTAATSRAKFALAYKLDSDSSDSDSMVAKSTEANAVSSTKAKSSSAAKAAIDDCAELSDTGFDCYTGVDSKLYEPTAGVTVGSKRKLKKQSSSSSSSSSSRSGSSCSSKKKPSKQKSWSQVTDSSSSDDSDSD